MLDHLAGRPSPTWKRGQVFLVLFFWAWRLSLGDGRRTGRKRNRNKVIGGVVGAGFADLAHDLGNKLRYRGGIFGMMGLINKRLRMFSPYQLIVGTLTMMYALRNLDVVLGLGSPEPLANLYSPAYYRASYIATAFDAGFATAMTIRPAWLRDICSILFSGYYMIWAREADEKLRRFRALCTVEMLRVTWEKTTNPYMRFLTYFDRPRLPLVKRVSIPRPPQSKHTAPISAMLFYAYPEQDLQMCSDLVLDFPGGGFVAMGPDCHEERLRRWAKRTGKAVLSVDYGKAPEYPYPWAIEEGFDVYRTIVQTQGSILGMRGIDLRIVLSGDSAGGNIVTTIMFNILESKGFIQRPIALVLAYPALDFNFTSWMTPQNLKTLKAEQSTNYLPGVVEAKDHMRHKSPLSVVDDAAPKSPVLGRKASWRNSLNGRRRTQSTAQSADLSQGHGGQDQAPDERKEHEKSLSERVKTPAQEVSFARIQEDLAQATSAATGPGRSHDSASAERIGTRITMTSRTQHFQDRILTPSMMRAMAILYIGPKHNPDFQTDYYISPILAPDRLLAQFPRVYVVVGEKDPVLDDSIVFAGRIREAKRLRKADARRLASAKLPRIRNDLRMSQANQISTDAPEDPILQEDEELWVQTRIVEGWGHGFLQMVSVMKSKAEPVILDIADWIDEAFECCTEGLDVNGFASGATPDDGNLSRIPSRQNLPKSFSLVKAVTGYKPVSANKSLGTADLGAPVGVALESEEPVGDGILEFTTRKRRESNSGSNSSRNSGLDMVSGVESSRLLPRNSSAPRFNISSELLNSHDSILPATLTEDSSFRSDNRMAAQRSGRSSFAMFGKGTAEGPRVLPRFHPNAGHRSSMPTRYQSPNRSSGSPGDGSSSRTDNGAKGLTEMELMRRRRVDAVSAYGLGEGSSTATQGENRSEAENNEQRSSFRW